MNKKALIDQFSPHLFWDVNRNNLDMENNKDYVIKQVLEYGLMQDWLLLKKIYGLNTIVSVTKTFRTLEKKTLVFIASISNTPLNTFRCYNNQLLIPQHGNF